MPADVLQFKLPLPGPDPYRVQIISISELRAGFWEVARPKIALVAKKMGADWIPDDVWKQIVELKAFLFAMFHGSDLVGIMVVRQDIDSLTGKAYVLAFINWFENFNDEIAAECVKFYDTLAAEMKTDTIRFYSPREGWVAKKHGCKISAIVWERRLG